MPENLQQLSGRGCRRGIISLLPQAHFVLVSAQYPQEDVAGFASYLLSQWQSLVSSSVYAPDLCSPAAASGGFSAATSISPHAAQLTASAQFSISTSIPVEHAGQQQHHGQQSASRVQSAQHQQAVPAQQEPQPQGFRPYNGRQTWSDAPQPANRPATQAAAAHMMSGTALPSFGMNAADTIQAASPAGPPMQYNTAGADTVIAHSTARNSNILAMPWVQSPGAQAPQSGRGFGPMPQLLSLLGSSPEQTAFQALECSFLKQAQMAPTPTRSPVHAPESEQQVCIFSLNSRTVRFVFIVAGQGRLHMESRLPTGILPSRSCCGRYSIYKHCYVREVQQYGLHGGPMHTRLVELSSAAGTGDDARADGHPVPQSDPRARLAHFRHAGILSWLHKQT